MSLLLHCIVLSYYLFNCVTVAVYISMCHIPLPSDILPHGLQRKVGRKTMNIHHTVQYIYLL